MQELARLVVHVDEAIRLSERPDDASLRLSLLLFDSAAELMLHRESQWALGWSALITGRLVSAEAIDPHGKPANDLPENIQRIVREQFVSPKRRDRIEREFSAKTRYLEHRGLLAPEYFRVMRKLHQYRNEAYHRDELRPATLQTAVRLYRYVVLIMMRDFPVYVGPVSPAPPIPQSVSHYFDAANRLGLELQAEIATQMLDKVGTVDPVVIGDLSEHALSRIDSLEETLAFIADFLTSIRTDEQWDSEAVLHFVQMGDSRWAADVTLEVARSAHVRAPVSALRRWRSEAEALVHEENLVVAFGRFADLEDDFEVTEDLVLEVEAEIDRVISRAVDWIRGK